MFFFLLGQTSLAQAQSFANFLDDFDPLEERIHVESSYVPNYREMMRDIVVALGQFARENNERFHVILDGGQDLLVRGEWENNLDDLHKAERAGAKTADERYLLKLFSPESPIAVGTPNRRFISSISGFLVRNQICGKKRDKLSKQTQNIMEEFGLFGLGLEHCETEKLQQKAVLELAKKERPVHADTDKGDVFDFLPPPESLFIENANNIDALSKVRNMLILTNTRKFSDKDLFIKALGQTNYDLLIIDPFFKKKIPLTKEEVKEIQAKRLGARRLVFAVLDVSEAEDTRLYWEHNWQLRNPSWLRFQSKRNPAGIIVDYWSFHWKKILGIYFKSIMDLGFDGIVLQGVDNHKIYERIIPIE